MPSALKAQTHPLAVVASPASPDTARQENAVPAICPHCFGSGMEVVPGNGARAAASAAIMMSGQFCSNVRADARVGEHGK